MMMKRLVALALAGIFLLASQATVRAQKEVAPPPIPPLLEDHQPLEHVETKEPTAPKKTQEKKAKVKSAKNQKKAKVKKPAGKKRQAVAKKKNQKAGEKKRPAETPKQAGPDEG
jgi:Skp family chaperone for outer membrane proteins